MSSFPFGMVAFSFSYLKLAGQMKPRVACLQLYSRTLYAQIYTLPSIIYVTVAFSPAVMLLSNIIFLDFRYCIVVQLLLLCYYSTQIFVTPRYFERFRHSLYDRLIKIRTSGVYTHPFERGNQRLNLAIKQVNNALFKSLND